MASEAVQETTAAAADVVAGSPLERYAAMRQTADATYAAWRTPERPRIDVAIDTSSLANGARATRDAIEANIAARNAVVDLGRARYPARGRLRLPTVCARPLPALV